jgi:hypothetical protein
VNSYSLASSPFMAVNSNPLAANQRDSQPCKVTASPFRCTGGLHGIPTKLEVCPPENSEGEGTRWLAAGCAAWPSKCAAREEGERIPRWRGRKEVRSRKRTWDEVWVWLWV